MKETISFGDFQKLDIRTGTILDAKPNQKAHKPAYVMEIDFGDLGIKISSAQITENYTPGDLKGKQIVAVVNFPPKNIAGVNSEVLVLGVMTDNKGVVLLKPDTPVNNGIPIA